MSSRKGKAFCKINRCGLGLEIGPSHNPLAPKREGYNVHIVDHCSASELREKYRDHGVLLDNIEEVDFVWHGEPLHELIGREGVYDFILVSHVIEHTTDVLSFLQECSRLLKPDGVLSLVIPDQRYCFDHFRWPSSTGDVLQAFIEKRQRHPAGVVFDCLSNEATCDGQIAWGEKNTCGEIKLSRTLDDAAVGWHAAIGSTDYIDVHEWRFTPCSFRLVLQDLRQMGLLDLNEVCAFPTEGCEFFYLTLQIWHADARDSPTGSACCNTARSWMLTRNGRSPKASLAFLENRRNDKSKIVQECLLINARTSQANQAVTDRPPRQNSCHHYMSWNLGTMRM